MRRLAVAVEVFGVFFPHPADEFAYLLTLQQTFDGVVIRGQFTLGKHRMDLAVADAMHGHGVAAAVALRQHVMLVERRAGHHGAATAGTAAAWKAKGSSTFRPRPLATIHLPGHRVIDRQPDIAAA